MREAVILKPEYINVEDVPVRGDFIPKWLKFFENLHEGKAALFKYNNRQRAHQVLNTVRMSARYHNQKIHTRLVHGIQAIHDTDDWLLYVWKDNQVEEVKMKILVEIPDGEYCNDGKMRCPLWKYGGSGSLLPYCKRFHKSPTPERHKFLFLSSVKLPECVTKEASKLFKKSGVLNKEYFHVEYDAECGQEICCDILPKYIGGSKRFDCYREISKVVIEFVSRQALQKLAEED